MSWKAVVVKQTGRLVSVTDEDAPKVGPSLEVIDLGNTNPNGKRWNESTKTFDAQPPDQDRQILDDLVAQAFAVFRNTGAPLDARLRAATFLGTVGRFT